MCRDFAFVLYFEIFFASRVRGNGTILQNFAFVPYTGHSSGRKAHAMRATVFRRWNYVLRFCICPPKMNLLRR